MNKESKNILIIDDSISIRNFIRGILEQSGYKIYEACDGEEGIELFKSMGNIDLVITDVYMPKKTGIEVVIELGKEYKNTKMIVLSDGGKYNFIDELGLCEAFGAICFMKKEFVKDSLVELVNRVLR
ncbi:response regulator [Clostridium tagluense]|uniref:response regulator n=1 Tax=Clostridium tagluense TaxID=360422 RepID=UPI001CF4983B|nr:response regulator [Clostridium tagluense]MCB2298518.1 response regulator [Clostridium tagluense]